MAYRKLFFRKLISLACLLWLSLQFSAYADPGIPGEFQGDSSESNESLSHDRNSRGLHLLQGEFKDSGLSATRRAGSGLNHLKGSDKTLEGKANLNVNQEEKMPPIAPPINRQRWNPGPSHYPVPGGLPPLNGRVNGFGAPGMPPFNGQSQDSRFGSPQKRPFFLGAKKDTTQEDRPSWLPAHAYSNANMVAPYHNSSLMWWDKSAMPDKPQWVVLSTSVTKYWRGRAPNPCWIMVSPNPLAPGNFTFRSRVRFGPRGWLQALNRTSKFGFPLYRYWLDQP